MPVRLILRPYRLLLGALVATGVTLGVTGRTTAAPEPPRPPSDEEARAVTGAGRALALLALAAEQKGPPVATEFGRRVAQAARYYLANPMPGFRDDCSGFVSAAFSRAGVPMDGRVATIWDSAVEHDALHWNAVPRVGDLVFFDETHDRNDNGRNDDELTHIGVVIDVEPDGVAVFAHAGTSRGRVTGVIDVEYPSVRRDATGRARNSYLREPEVWDPAQTVYLAGELWVAFATVDPTEDWLTTAPSE